MKVPFVRLDAIPEDVTASWLDAWRDIVRAGIFIGGDEVRKFEEDWAKTQVPGFHCVGVGNGLDALAVALRALGIGPGCRVVVPAHTFIATWLAVLAVGAEPVGVDVDDRGQLDVDLLPSVSPLPDAVIAVHMHGISPSMAAIQEWCASNGVRLVEDCAQAHGSEGSGKRVGQWGDASAFSFYPTKNIGAVGDAGLVAFRDRATAKNARSIANYGSAQDSKYFHERFGVNSRLDPIQAAALRVNLKYLQAWNSRRREIAQKYLGALSADSTVRPLCLVAEASVWHHFVLIAEDRDATRATLESEGVGTEIHYPETAATEVARFSKIPLSTNMDSFPQAEKLARSGLSIPMHPWLSDDEVRHVCRVLHKLAQA